MKAEQEIRTAIAEDYFNRALATCTANPGLIAKIRETFDSSLEEGLRDAVSKGNVGEDEAEELRSHFRFTPVGLKQYLEETSEIWMKNCDYYKAYWENVIEDLTNVGLLTKEVKHAYESLLRTADRHDRVVNRLVSAAIKSTIVEAIQERSIHDAIRAEFPTADEYVESMKGFYNAFPKLFSGAAEIEEDGWVNRLSFGVMPKVFKVALGTFVREDVKAIYGK